MEWNYGDAYKRYPIPDEGWQFDNGSIVKTHDIFAPLPEFMKKTEVIFVDPPWNIGNLNSFYTKANIADKQKDFERFYNRLFSCIEEINPAQTFIVIGKQYLAEFILKMKSLYRYVTFYNSSYYHKQSNICYIVHGAVRHMKRLPLEYLDEEDAIKWICDRMSFEWIGDLCMGRGSVGYYAWKAGKKFVGTELNHKRLSVLVERIESEKESVVV
ncbi:MAG TPA: hypothetical protein PLO55_12375 [Thermotogota bacterium]|nr:hypothetical protein [Thermotogota bacterium]